MNALIGSSLVIGFQAIILIIALIILILGTVMSTSPYRKVRGRLLFLGSWLTAGVMILIAFPGLRSKLFAVL